MSETAKLTIKDKELELPIIESTIGDTGIDISTLRSSTGGYITLDNGFGNTGAAKSAITYLNGEKGILCYRGYRIEELCEKSSVMEVSYLLIHGELPDKTQLENFESSIKQHTLLNEDIKRYWDVWPHTAHPMALLSSVVSALSTFYEDFHDPFNPDHVNISIHRLIGKLPTIAAFAYKKSIGQPKIYPKNSLSYTANFLNMMFAVPAEEYEIIPEIEQALNQLLIIHADHEQNCSTSTVRIVGSSHANLFASVAAGVLALWGPLHGGANQAVLEMLNQIHQDGGNVGKWLDKARDKNDPFRLMGFGHRVYKNFDPRATIIKKTCDKVFNKLGIKDPLLDIALKLEEVALKDQYFIDKKLYPNVDFYSGILYRTMGFPVKMFTVLFALGRLPGWIAHWKEMIESKETKIGRPRQVFIGHNERKYVSLDQR